jgi:hypothetical protein
MSDMLERDRNRLLRRADWRYLLPVVAPTRALCLGGTALRASCEVVATRVDDVPQPNVAYDLVVAENPDAAALRVLVAAMAPDGACYTEWTLTGPGGSERVRRHLAQVGFREPRTYHPWPSEIRCLAWLPTEGTAAAHYWRHAARTRVRRERVHQVFRAALARLGVHGRLSAVAVGPAASSEPHIVRIGTEHGVRELGGEVMLLTHGERAVGKIVALTFDTRGTPSIAIKTARTRESGHGLEREAELLAAVHASRPSGMPGVPRLLYHGEAAGVPVIGESALTGVPLAAILTRSNCSRLTTRVEAWSSALAEPASLLPAEPVWERLVGPALERFETEFAPVLDEVRIRRTRALLGALGPLPVVCEQRDFSPWNVFERAEGLVVLDWESGEPRGLPALDLIYFVTHAAYYLERAWITGRYEEAYATAWSRDSDLGRVNHACVARYLQRLGIEEGVLPSLRLFAWVLHAHSDYLHLRSDVGSAPNAAQLRGSRFFRLYEAELADASG